MKKLKLFLLGAILILAGCGKNVVKVVEVHNPTAEPRTNSMVFLPINDPQAEKLDFLAAFDSEGELPSQIFDSNNDGKPDQFLILVNLEGNETKTIEVVRQSRKSEFPQKAHAEVSEKRDFELKDGVYTGGRFESVKSSITPLGHIDHNFYYKMEGPGWESDKVGYRLYLDWRNSTDIFGKKVPDIVLPKVGHDKDAEGHDTYHTMADWGMDIFKVGNSLGIGTFGAWVDGKVVKVSKTTGTTATISSDGPIFANINIEYTDWDFGADKFTLNTNLSIQAGSRLTHFSADIPNSAVEFCTGLAKHENTNFSVSDNPAPGAWNFIALWGKQSLAGPEDELGIALFYNNNQKVELTEDELSQIVVLRPVSGKIDYYFAACWDQEPNGMDTEVKFLQYLDSMLSELNNPLNTQYVDK